MEKSMPPKIKRTLAMIARAACVTIFALFSSPSQAAEFRVLSAAAMQSVFKEIRDEFQRTTGYRLLTHYGTIGAVNEWTIGGEEADLIISSSQSMRWFVHQGKIQAGSETAICQTGIGIVTAAGIELSVTSVEDFKRALLAAKAIVYADPTRGGAAGNPCCQGYRTTWTDRAAQAEAQTRGGRRRHRGDAFPWPRRPRHHADQRDS